MRMELRDLSLFRMHQELKNLCDQRRKADTPTMLVPWHWAVCAGTRKLLTEVRSEGEGRNLRSLHWPTTLSQRVRRWLLIVTLPFTLQNVPGWFWFNWCLSVYIMLSGRPVSPAQARLPLISLHKPRQLSWEGSSFNFKWRNVTPPKKQGTRRRQTLDSRADSSQIGLGQIFCVSKRCLPCSQEVAVYVKRKQYLLLVVASRRKSKDHRLQIFHCSFSHIRTVGNSDRGGAS